MRLEGECTRYFGGDSKEGFVVADRGSSCAAETMGIGGKVSRSMNISKKSNK